MDDFKKHIDFLCVNKENLETINIIRVIKINIKEFRKKNKLTQKELAVKSHISLSHLNKIENIKLDYNFSVFTLYNISNALNVDIDKLCVEYADINYDKV